MDTDGPPPDYYTVLPPIELNHRSWWRSNFLQAQFENGPWSGYISLLHQMPERMRAVLSLVPESARFLRRHDRLGGLHMLLMAAGLVVAGLFGVLGWHHWQASSSDNVEGVVLLYFSLALLGLAGFAASILVGIDSFRMFLKAVDAYNEQVRGALKPAQKI